MPCDGKAGPQSHENDACIFRTMLAWHSPWYSLGTQSGGILYGCAAARVTASVTADLKRTSKTFPVA